MEAALCPVCRGAGNLLTPGVASTSAWPRVKTCHGWGGWGWVEVRELNEKCDLPSTSTSLYHLDLAGEHPDELDLGVGLETLHFTRPAFIKNTYRRYK